MPKVKWWQTNEEENLQRTLVEFDSRAIEQANQGETHRFDSREDNSGTNFVEQKKRKPENPNTHFFRIHREKRTIKDRFDKNKLGSFLLDHLSHEHRTSMTQVHSCPRQCNSSFSVLKVLVHASKRIKQRGNWWESGHVRTGWNVTHS